MPFQNLAGVEGMRPAGSSLGGFLEGILKGTEKFFPAYQEASEKKAKREKDKIDTYIKLREAGYSNEEAAQAIQTGKLLDETTGTDVYELQHKKEKLGVRKAELEVEKAEAERDKGWDKKLTPYQEEQIQRDKEGALTMIKTGRIFEPQYKGPMGVPDTREDYETFIIEKFPKISINDPKIQKALDEKFLIQAEEEKKPGKKEEEKSGVINWLGKILGFNKQEGPETGPSKGKEAKESQISLPETIQTTSEAVNYLMEKYGMTRNAAIDWIKANL